MAYLHSWQQWKAYFTVHWHSKAQKSTLKVSNTWSLWHEHYSKSFEALRYCRFVGRTYWNYLSCIAPDDMAINFPKKLTFILSEATVWIKGSQVSFLSKWQFLYCFMSFFNGVKYWGGRWRCFDQWRCGAWQLGMMNMRALWHESEILNNWFKKETSEVGIQKSGHQCQWVMYGEQTKSPLPSGPLGDCEMNALEEVSKEWTLKGQERGWDKSVFAFVSSHLVSCFCFMFLFCTLRRLFKN